MNEVMIFNVSIIQLVNITSNSDSSNKVSIIFVVLLNEEYVASTHIVRDMKAHLTLDDISNNLGIGVQSFEGNYKIQNK